MISKTSKEISIRIQSEFTTTDNELSQQMNFALRLWQQKAIKKMKEFGKVLILFRHKEMYDYPFDEFPANATNLFFATFVECLYSLVMKI